MKKNIKKVNNQEVKQEISIVKALRSYGYLPPTDLEMIKLKQIAKESNISIPDSLQNPDFVYSSKKKNSKMAISAKMTTYATLQILKNTGGKLPGSEVIKKIESDNLINFTDWEKNKDKETGEVRWQSILRWYISGLVKAELLLKERGVWTLTDVGDKATKLSPEQLFDKILLVYNKGLAKSKKR